MIAVDTNVLVYSIDADDPEKGDKAAALLRSLDPARTVLLWQVVCEFGAVVDRRRRRGTMDVDARDAIDMWLGIFHLAIPSRAALEVAWGLVRESQVSYWDALLLGACSEAGVTTLYTEDAQSSAVLRGVQMVNPFA